MIVADFLQIRATIHHDHERGAVGESAEEAENGGGELGRAVGVHLVPGRDDLQGPMGQPGDPARLWAPRTWQASRTPSTEISSRSLTR
jgi:hypothetical protein